LHRLFALPFRLPLHPSRPGLAVACTGAGWRRTTLGRSCTGWTWTRTTEQRLPG